VVICTRVEELIQFRKGFHRGYSAENYIEKEDKGGPLKIEYGGSL